MKGAAVVGVKWDRGFLIGTTSDSLHHPPVQSHPLGTVIPEDEAAAT